MMRWVAGLFVALICALENSAALTSAQVNAALGGQPGLNWTISGAEPAAWDTGNFSEIGDYLSLSIYSGYASGTYNLGTTVTGPGVLEVSRRNGVTMTSRILVDGTQTGGSLFQNPAYGAMVDRVAIPAGSHTVTWANVRDGVYASPIVYFFNAKWQPLTTLPLQVGVDGEAITLSGSWSGQNIWHHGDGGAAWSGLVPPVPAGSPVIVRTMRGDFSGAGVIGFRCMPRGGNGRVRLDGGAWEELSVRDVWTQHYLQVKGDGAHVIEFGVPSLVTSDRLLSEMLVDELTLSAEINPSVALDTPDLVWSAPVGYNGTTAYGTAMENARGNAGVILDANELTTPFPRAALVKIRAMGNAALRSGYTYLAGYPLSSEITPDGTWQTRAYEVPYPSGTSGLLGIYASERAWVDSFEIVEKPATLEAGVGLPPGTLAVGGNTPWQLQPVTSIGRYAARLALTEVNQSGWMEQTVTGPAEINLSLYNSDQVLDVLVDGKAAWTSAGPNANNRLPVAVRIEVPAGVHVVRYLAMIAPGDYAHYQSETWISSVAVTPLPAEGVLADALDFPGPFGTTGTWTISNTAVHQGAGALRPVSAVLMVPVTGPGYVKIWSYLNSRDNGSSFYFKTDFNQSFTFGSYSFYGDFRWTEHRIWMPPGEHQLQVKPQGGGEKRLDQLSFAPSETLPLEEVIAVEDSALESSPAATPWIGMRKQEGEPAVAISPMIEAGSPKKLSMTVNGPGKISFKWQTINRAAGGFLVNGVRTNLVLPYDSISEEGETIFVDAAGPVKLEWEAAYQEYNSYKKGWIELRDVVWSPVMATPFAEALDGPAGSVWTTSADHPFKGYPTPGAVGGTAANVVLGPGEESWLETTVEGPGVFDFSMLESVAKPAGVPSWNVEILLTVDGRRTYIFNDPQPQLILGDGTHRLRLSVQNYDSGSTNAVAIDAVTWKPATSTEAGPEWTADSPASIGSYPEVDSYGPDLIVLHPRAGGSQWIERRVSGPGLLSWYSRAIPTGPDWKKFSIAVDGVTVAPAESPEAYRQKYALHVPAGVHTVRFTADATGPPAVPSGEEDSPPSWLLSGMTFVPGESELMEVLDSTAGLWLSVGQDSSYFATGQSGTDHTDFWVMDESTRYYLINSSVEGCLVRMSTSYRQGPWEPLTLLLEPRSFVRWDPATADGRLYVFDSFSTEVVPQVPLGDALDAEGDFTGSGWKGLVTGGASDGTDAAFSILEGHGTNQLIREVEGPASVRFRWKSAGRGALKLLVDGKEISTGSSGDWVEGEVRVDEGTHSFTWSHSGESQAALVPAVAWVDALRIETFPVRSLDEVAGGPGFSLAASPPSSPGAWKPAFYRDDAGAWRDMAKASSGESILTTRITGPAIVSFRLRAWAVPPGIPWQSPDGGSFPLDDFILIKVGEEEKATVATWAVWQDAAVYVPAGEHQVSWQLMTSFRSSSGGTFTLPAADGHLEMGVDDITVQSPRSHYDAWATACGLPVRESNPKDDADHDGVINFMEYAFGSDPLDGNWKPLLPAVAVGSQFLSSDENSPMALHLSISRLPSWINGELQESSDLARWTRVPLESGERISAFPLQWWYGLYSELEFPITPGPRFFRFELEFPDED